MKFIWCHGFPEIYAQLGGGGGSICHGNMCIVLYMKLMWCSGFQEIYAQLEEGVGWLADLANVNSFMSCFAEGLFILHMKDLITQQQQQHQQHTDTST